MGGGFYMCDAAVSRSEVRATRSISQNFKSRKIDSEMFLGDKIREARDSEDHPQSFPIIIALDVTGSMGSIPQDLITNSLPKIMKKIMDEGVQDPQVLFLGIGDHYYDEAPVQVGQFESSDELMEKWLMKTWIEHGGGPNDGESYFLAWYIAARHTVTDSWEKRQKKGVLITIGDEPTLNSITKNDLKKFGFTEQDEITAEQMLAEAREKWAVYHINVKDYAGQRYVTRNTWSKLLGQNLVETQTTDGSDVDKIISGIVISEYKGESGEIENHEPEHATTTASDTPLPEIEVNPFL
jgi:hypothetical protein